MHYNLTKPWRSPTSTESRLIPNDNLELIEYDPIEYEEIYYHHNHFVRGKQIFQDQLVRGEGLN